MEMICFMERSGNTSYQSRPRGCSKHSSEEERRKTRTGRWMERRLGHVKKLRLEHRLARVRARCARVVQRDEIHVMRAVVLELVEGPLEVLHRHRAHADASKPRGRQVAVACRA